MVAKGKFSLTDLLNANSKTIEKITGACNDFKIDFISVHNLEPSSDNFYSVEDVADLKDSIELLGVQQNLTVVPLPGNDKYKVIAGHRRRLASLQLAEEGKTQFQLVPCRIETNLNDIKEQILLIYTNSTTRQLSNWEQIEQLVRLKNLLKEYKKTHELPGRVRELLAETLNMSVSQVGRLESINDNLTAEFKEELKQNKIKFSTAAELSRLPAVDQKAVYEQHKVKGSTSLKDAKNKKAIEIPGKVEVNKKVEHYQIIMNGDSGCIYKKKAQAIEDIKNELEDDMACNCEGETETSKYGIKTIMLTSKEFEELPEWEGW